MNLYNTHGYSDPSSQKSSYEISINKGDSELLGINYLRNQDLYGLLFKDVVGQYIVLENNNLKEFATKIGVENTDSIPDRIETTKITEYLKYEEIEPLVSKYLNIAIEEIPKDNYSEIEKEDVSLGDKTVQADGYQIKIKAKDMQQILKKVLETAKDDEQIFNLVNKISSEDMTFEDYQNNINDALTTISGEISGEENADFAYITVYKQGKDAIKLSINVIDQLEISINKIDTGLMLQFNNEYIISRITKTSNTEEQESFDYTVQNLSEEETGNFNITLNRTGSLTSNNVMFNMLISVGSEDESMNTQFNSTTNFSATPQFEEFTEDNHLIINELTPEQLNNLFTNLGNILSEKLKDEMFISFYHSMNSSLYSLTEQAADETQNAIEEESSLSNRTLTVDGVQYNSTEEYLNGI